MDKCPLSQDMRAMKGLRKQVLEFRSVRTKQAMNKQAKTETGQRPLEEWWP
jgi:hypothetical protein